MAKKKVAKKVTKRTAKPKIKTAPKQEVDIVACEREFRKHAKCNGGLRKGISDVDKMRALRLMELLGRKEIVWDKSIIPVQ